MKFNLLHILFGKPAAPAPHVKADIQADNQADVRDQALPQQPAPTSHSDGRYYHTVTLPEGKSFDDLTKAFAEVGFTPQPRARIGHAFLGQGYSPDPQTGTARILAAQETAAALRTRGYPVAIDRSSI